MNKKKIDFFTYIKNKKNTLMILVLLILGLILLILPNGSLKKSNSQIEIHIEKNFEQAVNLAKSIANKNDIVLLSPACASFDAFDNFMQRGNRFKEIVNSFK